MTYGDQGGAIGYLIGEENSGIACMFTMMNRPGSASACRASASPKRAYQQALALRAGTPPGPRARRDRARR